MSMQIINGSAQMVGQTWVPQREQVSGTLLCLSASSAVIYVVPLTPTATVHSVDASSIFDAEQRDGMMLWVKNDSLTGSLVFVHSSSSGDLTGKIMKSGGTGDFTIPGFSDGYNQVFLLYDAGKNGWFA